MALAESEPFLKAKWHHNTHQQVYKCNIGSQVKKTERQKALRKNQRSMMNTETLTVSGMESDWFDHKKLETE